MSKGADIAIARWWQGVGVGEMEPTIKVINATCIVWRDLPGMSGKRQGFYFGHLVGTRTFVRADVSGDKNRWWAKSNAIRLKYYTIRFSYFLIHTAITADVTWSSHCVQGPRQPGVDPRFELGAKSSAEGAPIEAPGAENIWMRYREEYTRPVKGCPSSPLAMGLGGGMLGSRNAYLVHFYTHLSTCFCSVIYVRDQTSSTPAQSEFLANCGLIKGAWVSAEDGTEHYLPR